MVTDFDMLEFPAILQKLQECAVSDAAKETLAGLRPELGETACVQRMAETTAARQMLDACGAPPLAMMNCLVETVALCEAGDMPLPEQLTNVALFADACRRLYAYLSGGASQHPQIASYRQEIKPLDDLRAEIERCVDEERVLDEASPALHSLRRKTERLEAEIREKLNRLLQTCKQTLADSYVTRRGGHYVLPVQRRYQNQFDGTVVETSATGVTVFMEPRAIAALQAELAQLAVEEDAETRRVLYTLGAYVADDAEALRRNRKTMVALDALFARAKLSALMNARVVEIGCERRTVIRRGRHPLLPMQRCVPLDLTMDNGLRGVIVTGPNTGGKTVTLKTMGLLSLMAQCGLHIPCDEGSYIAMQDGFWCDIGDQQDIAQNLSTFSGHMTNLIRILQNASPDSLVLLDELGSGTDPAEGEGIAVAVLDELLRRRCMFLVTTHYPQVKTYAETTPSVLSARMAFDETTLAPLYQLEMGKSGESCALHIAARLGFPPKLLARAHRAVYGTPETTQPQATDLPTPRSALKRAVPPDPAANLETKFTVGDSVLVLPQGETGIVFRPVDKQGDVIVQVKGEKRLVKHNRLKLRVPAAELYPPDYDFSIIFDSVANRKASHILSKRYDPDAMVVHEKSEY